MTKIAIQGQAGSFHDAARLKLFPNSQLVEADSFYEVFEKVLNDEVDGGVVAIENSIYGSINEVYDLLINNGDIWITGEAYIHVKLSLLANKGTKIEDVNIVRSHSIALAESKEFLRSNLPNCRTVATTDTAVAAEQLYNKPNGSEAVVASVELAKRYNLEVLQENIEHVSENYTRFISIGKQKDTAKNPNKTSIAMSLPERPGSLYEALGLFAQRDINLSKLTSRPIPEKAWQYVFYIDFEASLSNALGVLDDLAVRGSSITVLGSYNSTKQNPSIDE
jgi:chorismate mutase/prephenate dehydratase